MSLRKGRRRVKTEEVSTRDVRPLFIGPDATELSLDVSSQSHAPVNLVLGPVDTPPLLFEPDQRIRFDSSADPVAQPLVAPLPIVLGAISNRQSRPRFFNHPLRSKKANSPCLRCRDRSLQRVGLKAADRTWPNEIYASIPPRVGVCLFHRNEGDCQCSNWEAKRGVDSFGNTQESPIPNPMQI